MISMNSIAQKFRLSYFIFTAILCLAFVGIFFYAGIHMEQVLVKSRLLQQLALSMDKEGIQAHYSAKPNIDIYHFEVAPPRLQRIATEKVQEMYVNDAAGQKGELHFFTHTQDGQQYVLTYLLDDRQLDDEDYPVLAIFEHFEYIFLNTLLVAVLLSFIIAAIFSYVSAHQITKPLSSLKHAERGRLDAAESML